MKAHLLDPLVHLINELPERHALFEGRSLHNLIVQGAIIGTGTNPHVPVLMTEISLMSIRCVDGHPLKNPRIPRNEYPSVPLAIAGLTLGDIDDCHALELAPFNQTST